MSLALRPGFKHCRTRSKHSQRSRPGLDASERIREASEAGPQGPPFSQREMEKNGIEMVRHRSVGENERVKMGVEHCADCLESEVRL